jgi:hypothetical protein
VAALVTSTVAVADDSNAKLLIPAGMSASIGGGVGDFTDPDLTRISSVAGTWTARLTLGTRTIIGGEVAYLGTAQTLDTLGLSDKAFLLSNGVEGLLRVNFMEGTWQPYALVGVAWRRFSVQNSSSNTSSVADNDDIAEIPMAVGVAYRYQQLIVDARADFRPSLLNDLVPNTVLTNWQLGARVGFEF